tara:strand:- start:35889 stop:36311 length:423 start_codon:yes stop_codon:yes gene_type:complete
MKVKIQKISDIDTPSYAKQGDAALDLRAAESILLKAGDKYLVKTGIKMAIPPGYVGLIWDRSGLAVKNEIHALAGVVDSGYRGEVCVVLKNLGKEDFQIEKNMRIAQMIIQPHITATLEEVNNLEQSERGQGGFGSTGLK